MADPDGGRWGPGGPIEWAVRLGVVSIIALFLVGAIPGLPSPFHEITKLLQEIKLGLLEEIKRLHASRDQEHREQIMLLHILCARAHREDPAMMRYCYDRTPAGPP